MRTPLKTIVGLGVFCMPLVGQGGHTVPLSVCTVLANRLAYNGKMVTVRGEVEGTMEGAWLFSDECPRAVVTFGYRWGNDIALSPTSWAMNPVDFIPDRASDERIRQQFKKLNVDRKKVRLFITYVGVFETREDSELYVRGAGRPMNGFGHLNGSPAQLIVKTSRDLEVKPRDKRR